MNKPNLKFSQRSKKTIINIAFSIVLVNAVYHVNKDLNTPPFVYNDGFASTLEILLNTSLSLAFLFFGITLMFCYNPEKFNRGAIFTLFYMFIAALCAVILKIFY